ncbi:hypothetical protein BS17DRAFT_790557 [Gyrodon lividus]|nr:hypothetical protein BS17DRAFT_790557 [Gyrodon lividus]
MSSHKIFPYYPYRSERLNVPNYYCFPCVEQFEFVCAVDEKSAPEAGSSGSQRT